MKTAVFYFGNERLKQYGIGLNGRNCLKGNGLGRNNTDRKGKIGYVPSRLRLEPLRQACTRKNSMFYAVHKKSPFILLHYYFSKLEKPAQHL